MNRWRVKRTIRRTLVSTLVAAVLLLAGCADSTDGTVSTDSTGSINNTDSADNTPLNLLVNPGFEEQKENQLPVAWKLQRHGGKSAYRFSLDSDEVFSGTHSYRIEQSADQVYGMIKQRVTLPEGHGDTFTFTAMMKTADIQPKKGWRLVVTCLRIDGRIMGQFKSDPMTGTTDWQRITIEEVMPVGTARLDAGVMLQSIGTGWIDDASISVN